MALHVQHSKLLETKIFNQFIIDNRNTYILITKWANGGSLRNYLKLNFSNMTGDEKLGFTMRITKGIMCLHQKNIIHRDLAKIQFFPVFHFGMILIIAKNTLRILPTSWF